MHAVYGLVMTVIGVTLIYWSATQSNFIVFRLLRERSRLIWGDNVHLFYVVVGTVLIGLGLLWAFGLIWN